MQAILRDSKGWTKTLTIPYAMPQIRLPIYRKHANYYTHNDLTTVIEKTKTKDMVIFEFTGRGLNDNCVYYDEIVDSGASGNMSSPYGESHGGATPSTASSN